ncbi:MAG: hypothetical protein ACR2IQ_00895 [Minisyncoccia bacterium]
MNENNMEKIYDGSPESLPREMISETTPEQDIFEMKKAFAEEHGISVDDVIEVNGHFVVSENATTIHTKNDGTVN